MDQQGGSLDERRKDSNMSATLTPPIELGIRCRFRRRRPRPCPCGTGCGVKDGFCEPHRAQLAVWRQELEAEGGWRNTDKRECVTVGCWNRPAPRLLVCDECAEAAE